MSSARPFADQLKFKNAWNPDHLRTGPVGEKVHNRLGISTNKPTLPTPAPPILEDVAGREQDTADMLRRRRGRAASVLTDGNAGVPMTASKTLLGS